MYFFNSKFQAPLVGSLKMTFFPLHTIMCVSMLALATTVATWTNMLSARPAQTSFYHPMVYYLMGVSVTVTTHHDSTRIKHHTIGAVHLTLSPPRGKNQKCLILKGERAGQVHKVKDCKSRQQKMVLYNGISFTFDDICLVIDTA